MDQYLDNRHKEIVWTLLENPADNGQAYLSTLQRLVNDNPQSGLLQVLLARAAGNNDLKTAAAYFNAKTLHKLVHNPDSLAAVDNAKVIKSQINQDGAATENYFSIPIAEEETPVADNKAEQPEQEWVPQPEPESISNEPETIIVPTEPQPGVIENEPQTTEADAQSAGVSNEPETVTVTRGQEPDEINEPQQEEKRIEETPVEPKPAAEIKEQPAPFGIETVIPEFEKPEMEGEIAVENTFAIAEEPEPEPEFDIITADNGYRDEKEYFRQDIEDEIYDEIVGIEEIGIHKPADEPLAAAKTAQQEPAWTDTEEQQYNGEATEEEQAVEAVVPVAEQPAVASEQATEVEEQHTVEINNIGAETTRVQADEEKLILGNIVSADYLSFDKKLDELRNGNQKPAETTAPSQPAETVNDKQDVSRYNDDTLPYSFMWWLDKTRKEHADSFQPYAAGPVDTHELETPQSEPEPAAHETPEQPVKPVHRKAPDELQQQYYENIFSLTSISSIEADEHAARVAFDHNKKEDVIIERFITTEPQIKPPAADKLDNENKAKKSSEDQDALVTETLARIYTDQMLYHKAIATYKKLLLKFPEKKLYFASQIEQLEKKTN